MPQIIPTAEPFFFPGKPDAPGCLLVHGFTGAPKEMRWMGEYLAGQGFSALGVRLAGHATRPEDMIRTRYTDWMDSVEDGYHLLRGATDRIFLVGLSMGGILALLMSTRLDVAGVVAMSTPYQLADPRVKLAKLISPFFRYLPKTKEPPGSTWFDKEAWREHVSYPQNPVRSIAELPPLLAEMRAALPRVEVPVLLVHSRNDTYVPSDSMQNIYDALGTPDKQMMWVTESGHVIPREPAKEQVFKAAADFIRRVSGAAA
ncbi:MAG: alpha/beta fold hydrolase [Chloroflexi bacterium]|nr:alpha/beta fold hydrolase [Chloroflexota bacterium]